MDAPDMALILVKGTVRIKCPLLFATLDQFEFATFCKWVGYCLINLKF